MEFIRSTILDAHTMAAEVKTYDLPINPISHLVLTVEGHALTDEPTIADILGFINLITVRHTGIQIINLESEDLALLNLYLFGSGGLALAPGYTEANQYLAYSLIIPFGRKLYNPEECFPATRKGEFQITLDTELPAGEFDDALMSISAIQLPEATPARHLVSTLFSITNPGDTGEHDIDLPIGNDLLACLIRMTSFPAADAVVFGLDDLRLLFDNRELDIVSSKAPELAGEMINRVNGTVRTTLVQGGLIPNTCIWMDFDPTKDGQYMVNTRPAARVHLRVKYGVDEAVFIAPLELRTI